MIETATTWYGFPIPWFFTRDSIDSGYCYGLTFSYSGIVRGAFLLDVLIYMAIYYAPVLAYLGIRRAILTRIRLRSNVVKPVP